MVCTSCRTPISRNFVSYAIFGKPVGQNDFFADLMEWWNSLEPMYRYAIIGGAGLFVVVILFLLLKPSSKADIKSLEELVRLKMLKELTE